MAKIEKKNVFFIHLFLILVVLSCLLPLLWMISSSLKSQTQVFSDMSFIPQKTHWNNYIVAWEKANFGQYFFNSVFYTFFSVAGILFFASLAAYAFSRFQFPGCQFLFYLFIASMMIPIPGAFIPLYVILIKLGLANTRLGLILPYINTGLALGIFILKGFFDKIPRDLEDAAKIDGCSEWGIYLRVMLPLVKPALATVGIFATLQVWNEFLLALIIINNRALLPLQVGLFKFQGEHFVEYPLLMAGLTISTIPIVIVYMFLQKHIIKGMTAGAFKG